MPSSDIKKNQPFSHRRNECWINILILIQYFKVTLFPAPRETGAKDRSYLIIHKLLGSQRKKKKSLNVKNSQPEHIRFLLFPDTQKEMFNFSQFYTDQTLPLQVRYKQRVWQICKIQFVKTMDVLAMKFSPKPLLGLEVYSQSDDIRSPLLTCSVAQKCNKILEKN